MTPSTQITVFMAFVLMALCCAGALLFHLGGKAVRRWRQGRVEKARWMRLLK